jgi:MFS family permease
VAARAPPTLHAGDAGFGALVAAWGVGMPVGAVVFARRGSTNLGVLTVVSSVAVGVSYLVTGVAPTLLVACAGAVLGGAGNAIQWVSVVTLLQGVAEPRRQAAVAGALEAVSWAMPALGFALGGAVAALADPRAGYVLAGVGVLTVTLAAVVLRPRAADLDVPPGSPPRPAMADVPGAPLAEPSAPVAS